MRRFLLAAPVLALAGCVTAQEQMALDDEKCRSFGTMRGTPDYTQCRMFVEQERNRERESERQAQAAENIARTLAPRPRPVFNPVQPVRQCRVTPTGMVCV
jgi:hypothetical protein